MAIETTGIAHIGLRVTDTERAVAFYKDVLGFEVVREMPGRTAMNAYGTMVAVIGADDETPEGDSFNPFRVGLDHIALGVGNDALEGLATMLDEAGARNNGVQTDEMTGVMFISVYDPDGIAWEFFGSRPE